MFAPNRVARTLYARLGFVERDLELLRPLPRESPMEGADADGR